MRVVENQRSGADSGVVVAFGVRKQRIPPRCRVGHTRREVFKSVGPFCRGKTRIAAIRWWKNRLRAWRKRNASNGAKYCCDGDVLIFHKGLTFVTVLSLENFCAVRREKPQSEFGQSVSHHCTGQDRLARRMSPHGRNEPAL